MHVIAGILPARMQRGLQTAAPAAKAPARGRSWRQVARLPLQSRSRAEGPQMRTMRRLTATEQPPKVCLLPALLFVISPCTMSSASPDAVTQHPFNLHISVSWPPCLLGTCLPAEVGISKHALAIYAHWLPSCWCIGQMHMGDCGIRFLFLCRPKGKEQGAQAIQSGSDSPEGGWRSEGSPRL